MPDFEFVKTLSAPQFKAVREMYVSLGWWYQEDDASRLERLVAGSLFFCLALEGGEVVGMGRAIGDGISDAYIQDVAVREDQRKKGIASELVRRLVRTLRDSGYTWIGLIATPKSGSLYQKLGFEALEGYTPMWFKQTDS